MMGVEIEVSKTIERKLIDAVELGGAIARGDMEQKEGNDRVLFVNRGVSLAGGKLTLEDRWFPYGEKDKNSLESVKKIVLDKTGVNLDDIENSPGNDLFKKYQQQQQQQEQEQKQNKKPEI